MGNCDYQQSIRTGQIMFFPKLKANGPKPDLQKTLKHGHPKKKKKKNTKNGNIFWKQV